VKLTPEGGAIHRKTDAVEPFVHPNGILAHALADDIERDLVIAKGAAGAAPGENCGIDTAPDGSGEIREPRLYQLIRQKGPIVDRTFEIEFLDLGVHALDFTFG